MVTASLELSLNGNPETQWKKQSGSLSLRSVADIAFTRYYANLDKHILVTPMQIFASTSEDAQQGWVWLQKPDLPARSIVKLTCIDTRKSIYCEALQIDTNYLNSYNQPPRLNITNPTQAIVINAWHRAKLGGIHTQTDVKLDVKAANSLWGKIRACIDHPQIAIRAAIWLGLLSVALGLIGIAPLLVTLFTIK